MRRKSSGFASILIIIIIVGVAVGAYFWVTQSKIPPIQVLQSPTPTPYTVENWKTYTNKKLGFEFKYPGDLNQQILTNGVIKFLDKSGNSVFNYSGFDFKKMPDGLIEPKVYTDDSGRKWTVEIVELGEGYNFTGYVNINGTDVELDLQGDLATNHSLLYQILSTFRLLE